MNDFVSLHSRQAFEVVCKCLFVKTDKNGESGKHTTPESPFLFYERKS
jgi:hypothetical protein